MFKKVEGKVSMPPKIIVEDSEKCSVLRTYIGYYELNKQIPILHKFLLYCISGKKLSGKQ
jgi:hypothetical protein